MSVDKPRISNANTNANAVTNVGTSTPPRGMVPVQVLASQVVGRVLGGRNLDRELAEALQQHNALTSNERQAVHSICFDTLRNAGLLQAQLDTLLSQPITDQALRHLLLVALAQLQFSKAAAHAIVDHAVDSCDALGLGRGKGLVNAVLRNYLRAPNKFERSKFKDIVARYDHPRWWINKLKAAYPQEFEEMLDAAAKHPPMHLRVNARGQSVDAAIAALAKEGIAAKQIGGDAISLDAPVGVNALPGFDTGMLSVQDLGAQVAAHLIDCRDGMRVLDACAAPGGKTAHILERSQVDLLALDTDKFRSKRISENLRRLSLTASVQTVDACKLDAWWDQKQFDRILIDAPCSGSGVTRRHPDIKWIRRESDLKQFARTQTALLDSLWPTLSKGGVLLYVTCSVFDEENVAVVEAFLKSHPDAIHQEIDTNNLAQMGVNAVPRRFGVLLPTNNVHDGFYYARIQKAASS
jgi:16S rRNA (cytosine967-C5)-methyltransferase